MKNPQNWDIFCKVIDNFGDVGVCWRLCHELAERGCKVRLWLDDLSALHWMVAHRHPDIRIIHWCRDWHHKGQQDWRGADAWPDVLVEAFGCDPDPIYLDALAHTGAGVPGRKQPVWINLEYLSAEPYVERCHGLASPTSQHRGLSEKKYFFYPGFTPQTGGLLREQNLVARRACFDQKAFLQGIDPQGATTSPAPSPPLRVSLFCYHNAPTRTLLKALLQNHDAPSIALYVTPGQAQEALSAPGDPALQDKAISEAVRSGRLRIVQLDYLSQDDFDHLLWACDLNLVRGEDSLVRALWAQKPFLWHIYQQEDGSHLKKLEAFIQIAKLNDAWAGWMRHWNKPADAPNAQYESVPTLRCQDWAQDAQNLGHRLEMQGDLVSQLFQFTAERQ